jgi:hypothetical protein
MRNKLPILLTVILLTPACWLFANFTFGASARRPAILILLALLCWLSASALVWAVRRWGIRAWLSIGLVNLAALTGSIYILEGQSIQQLPSPMVIVISLLPTVIPAIALVMGACLLGVAHREWQAGGEESPAARRAAGQVAAAALGLGALLVIKSLHNLYWLTVWDTTNDPIGYFWIGLPVLATVLAGGLLASFLPGWAKWTGLGYPLLLVPALIAISASAQQVDFRQLTAERAERVSQAIETYYAREGRYPQSLGQLTPRYTLSLPGPVIIYGQDWCYRSGPDYYQLGYVNRDHWSSPLFTRQTYKSHGEVPDPDSLCAAEIAAIYTAENSQASSR